MQKNLYMKNTVKDTLHTIGDRSSELAKAFGSETADLAKHLGNRTARLAKQIGPRRGVIGVVVLAATIGGTIMLVRYLRARKLDKMRGTDETGDNASTGQNARQHDRSRAQRTGDMQQSH
jgi:hypothetical protein